MAEVVFIDTSVLLNLLDVPGKNSDHQHLVMEFKQLAMDNVTFVIPIAAVIEVGNHIAQLSSGDLRRNRARRFADYLRSSLEGEYPWVVSGALWNEDFVRRLVDGHGTRPGLEDLCLTQVGSGDASILHELDRFRDRADLPSQLPIRLWTLDAQLKAYA